MVSAHWAGLAESDPGGAFERVVMVGIPRAAARRRGRSLTVSA